MPVCSRLMLWVSVSCIVLCGTGICGLPSLQTAMVGRHVCPLERMTKGDLGWVMTWSTSLRPRCKATSACRWLLQAWSTVSLWIVRCLLRTEPQQHCVCGTHDACGCAWAAKHLYTFGRNNFGQLGLGDTLDRWTPTLVTGFDNVTHASAGRDHILFIDSACHRWSG